MGNGIGGPLPTPLLPTEDVDSCLVRSDGESQAKATLGDVGADGLPAASVPGREASVPGRVASSPKTGAALLTAAAVPLTVTSVTDSHSVDRSISWRFRVGGLS